MRAATPFSLVVLVPLTVFAVFFASGPVLQLEGLRLMPGNMGDARLNNYFLENIYLCFSGAGNSLFHLNFFWPFPYVGGFSDNLFGSSPPYLLARALGAESDTAFQIWFLVGYAANFAASCYALRRLNLSLLAAAIGAAVFTFALPVAARVGHAQLHYRFGVPLALTMLTIALERKSWQHFLWSVFWLVWQFFCSIYIGVFTAVLMSVMVFSWMFRAFIFDRGNHICAGLYARFRSVGNLFFGWDRIRATQMLAFAVLAGLIAILFFPYAVVSESYGFQRSIDEISTMLPRVESYWVSDASRIWMSDSELLASLPMRHEHQMLFGVSVLVLAVYGAITGFRQRRDVGYVLLASALIGAGMMTISIAGWSLWHMAAKLPLVSAIRAVTRIDMVMLFPLAFLAALGVQNLSQKRGVRSTLVLSGAVLLLVLELYAVSPMTSRKEDWRARLRAKEQVLPDNLAQDAVLFFSQNTDLWYADELDAMWVALQRDRPTLNGYTGNIPAGCKWEFGDDTSEAGRRVRAYFSFTGKHDSDDDFRQMMSRVVLLGFPLHDSSRDPLRQARDSAPPVVK